MRIPLPTDYTVFQFLIPSLGVNKKFRPFTVKENKALLAAQSTEDDIIMVDTLAQVISNCCLEELDVSKLALFDVEYLLIKLRSISINQTATLLVTCNDPHDGFPEATRKNEITLDINAVEVQGLDSYKTLIKLSDTLSVKMKAPTLNVLKSIHEISPDDSEDQILNTAIYNLAVVMESIITPDEVINVSECSMQDLQEWLESLLEDQFTKLRQYFDNIPRSRIKLDWTCPVCGKRNIQYIEGLRYFFS